MARATPADRKETLTVGLPPAHKEALLQLAEQFGVPIGQMIRWAVQTYLEGPGEIPQPKRPE